MTPTQYCIELIEQGFPPPRVIADTPPSTVVPLLPGGSGATLPTDRPLFAERDITLTYEDVAGEQRPFKLLKEITGGLGVMVGLGLFAWWRWEMARNRSTTRKASARHIKPTLLHGRGSMLIARLWSVVGWRGVVMLIGLSLAMIVFGWPDQSAVYLGLFIVAAFVVIWFLLTASHWGIYQAPRYAVAWDDEVRRIQFSREEYCLILRPFGEDGRIFLPHVRGMLAPNDTLEQTIARAAHRALGFKAYALVDQDQSDAPPGPMWLQTPSEGGEWKRPVEALIGRAHSIVLILPPHQVVRDSLKWEIGQITRKQLQTRVVIVLPPPDRARDAYLRAFDSMCGILRIFDGFGGDFDDAVKYSVEGYRSVFSGPEYGSKTGEPNVLIAKLAREGSSRIPTTRWWYAKPKWWKVHRYIGAKTYQSSLEQALTTIKVELAQSNFNQRYPWWISSLSDLTGEREHLVE